MVLAALSVALMPVTANANGNMVDSFTYNGNQSGFTRGTVYALSIAGNELNVCEFTPVPRTSAPSLEYNPNCQNAIAQSDSPNSYTAVAYLGTANNAGNYFAVGDSVGNVYVMQIEFKRGDPNPISVSRSQPLQIKDPDDTANSCGSITSLAVDPNGGFLYISCMESNADANWTINNDKSYTGMFGVTLQVATINNGTLSLQGNVASAAPPGISGYWTYGPDDSASRVTAAAFPGGIANTQSSNLTSVVNPKLRVYPPNYPGLAGTSYSSTGAVFYSGIISGISGSNPINSGFMCSNGVCQVAYNIALPQGKDYGGWIFTAAEYGTNQAGTPVLFWNQVFGIVQFSEDASSGLYIDNKMGNALTTCQLNASISNAVTTSPCSAQANLQWPPANVPSSNIWVDQLVYSPTPTAVANSTNYTQGLLQMSLWNSGYLAYYDVASGSNVPGVFFSNNQANGEVGANVQGLSTDSNGNLLIQAGASGLLGFNAFPTSSTNIETQTYVTYVPIPADTPPSSCGTACKVIQGLGIVASVVSDISVVSVDDDKIPTQTRFALQAPVAKTPLHTTERSVRFSSSEPDAASMDTDEVDGSFRIAMNFGGDMSADVVGYVLSDSDPSLLELAALSTEAAGVQCCDSNADAPNPALANFLGQKPYWGSFTYTEQQLRLLGIRPGDKIKGVQLRLAEGISAQPKQTLRFKNVQIALKSGATTPSAQAGLSFDSIVFRRSLSILRCSYNRSVRDGYGPVIPFRTYRYLGGDLTLTLRHSGSGNSKRFYLDAFGGAGVIGAYAELSSVWSQPTNVTELKVAPQIKLIKKGTSPKRVKYPSRCG